ncbi:MAK10-like protein [Tanacetum coccineum]
MYNEILDKYVKSLELGKNGSAFIQGEMPKKLEDPGLFTLPCRLGDSVPFDTLADLGACINIIPLYLFKKLNIGLLEETDHVFGLADGTKSYPIRIVRDVEVHIGRLKLLTDVYVIGARTPYYARKDFLDCHLLGEWEIARDAKLNPFKDVQIIHTGNNLYNRVQEIFKENKKKIFTFAGDGVRIYPDAVVIFDEKKLGRS